MSVVWIEIMHSGGGRRWSRWLNGTAGTAGGFASDVLIISEVCMYVCTFRLMAVMHVCDNLRWLSVRRF